MLSNLMKKPIALGGIAIALFTAITGSANFLLDGGKAIFNPENLKIAEASNAKSCFDKTQTLTDGTKQGVTVCFENSLENSSVSFFSIDKNGIRTSKLKDEEKFKKFINLESLQADVDKADKEMPKQVKGINSSQTPTEIESQLKIKILSQIDIIGF